MDILNSAVRENATVIVSVLAIIVTATVAMFTRSDFSNKAKTVSMCVCFASLVIACLVVFVVLRDTVYITLPNVIGMPKDEAARMIEDLKITKPRFTGVPSSDEADTIIALFDDHDKELHAGERVPRNIQIIGYYAILPTSKPTVTPIATQTPKPTATPTPTPEPTATATATPIPTPDPIVKVGVGDWLTFGSYQGLAIAWRVLAVEDDRVLVISERMLDARPYNDKFISVTWETSTLRAWLNNDFYRAAFTEAEKARIVETTVMNSDNATYDTAGGNNTLDRVFLLRIEEAENYFSDDKERMAKGTLYAEKQGLLVHNDTETDWWWLRSPGYYTVNAACVYNDGTLHPEGHIVNDDTVGVRPALWLNQ